MIPVLYRSSLSLYSAKEGSHMLLYILANIVVVLLLGYVARAFGKSE
jgi:hypothetical protein